MCKLQLVSLRSCRTIFVLKKSILKLSLPIHGKGESKSVPAQCAGQMTLMDRFLDHNGMFALPLGMELSLGSVVAHFELLELTLRQGKHAHLELFAPSLSGRQVAYGPLEMVIVERPVWESLWNRAAGAVGASKFSALTTVASAGS
jgi:hypothetical protein